MSAKIGAIFWPHERQAPIIRPATEGGDCEAGRLAGKGESGGRRYVWVPAAEPRSFCTEGPAGRVVPATGEYRVAPEGEGEGPRHLASAQKSQHNYPAKTLRAGGDGVGQAEPLAPAFQLSPSTATKRFVPGRVPFWWYLVRKQQPAVAQIVRSGQSHLKLGAHTCVVESRVCSAAQTLAALMCTQATRCRQ